MIEEQDQQPDNSDHHQERLKMSFSLFVRQAVNFMKDILNLRRGLDAEGTIEGIKSDIEFRGHNVWILICSIFIASIGLNVNSYALIIGAMLISPLMGPILGVGLGVGTNDIPTLKKSLRNWGTTVGISVLTSTLYFIVTPFGEVQSELIARTNPTLLDVLIAIFGGLAGIIAWTRKERNTNVIPGVAIATALMPPLCTAGFGLATLNFNFFLGAFYLFLINSVFISIATLVVVRVLGFPLVHFVEEEKERKVKNYVLLFVLVLAVPSIYTFYRAIREGVYKRNAQTFISENFKFQGTEVISYNVNYNYDEQSEIEVYLLGMPLSDREEQLLNDQMEDYKLKNTDLQIYQNKTDNGKIVQEVGEKMKSGIIEDLYIKHSEELEHKDSVIASLNDQIIKLKGQQVPMTDLAHEVKVQYADIERLAFASTMECDMKDHVDTIPTFYITCKKSLEEEDVLALEKQLEAWLAVRLKNDRIKVKHN